MRMLLFSSKRRYLFYYSFSITDSMLAYPYIKKTLGRRQEQDFYRNLEQHGREPT